MIYIGLDDTDTLDSPGTGRVAREIAGVLGRQHEIRGVIRHQLWFDSQVRCTKNNSSAAILLEPTNGIQLSALLEQVRAFMLDRFQPGSDPGLCVAADVDPAVTAFGRRAQRELVTQSEARALAKEHGILLVGLGGDESGVIGALSAVGLAASGEDGRYVLVGRSRELAGLQPVSALLAAGIVAVRTRDGQPVQEGMVQVDRLRPARRAGKPVAVVEWTGEYWTPLKLD